MKGISGAVLVFAILCCFAPSRGWALQPAAWQPGRSPVLNLYYSGSAGMDRYFDVVFMGTTTGICQPNSIDIYRPNASLRVIFCRARAGIRRIPIPPDDVPAGTPIAFHQSSMGGSAGGLISVTRQQAYQFFNMALASTCTSPILIPMATVNNHTIWTNCVASTVAQIPDVSVSDTEATTSIAGLTLTEISELRQAPGAGTVLGVAVTRGLYRALQLREGLPQDDAQASMPSLARQEIRDLLSRQFTDWTSITDSAGTPLPQIPGVIGPWNNAITYQYPDSSVFVCRGVDDAGVQASSEIYWFEQRCPLGPPGSTFATADHAGYAPNQNWTAGGGFVHSSSNAAQLRNCFNAHEVNGTWAIGTISTEVALPDMSPGDFRLVRVDGAVPNLASAGNELYDFFTESVIVRRQVAPLPPAIALPLIQYIEVNVGKPAAHINVTYRSRPWGDGGQLSIPTPANPPSTVVQVDGSNSAGQMRSYPVGSLYRSAGGLVNNCGPATAYP